MARNNKEQGLGIPLALKINSDLWWFVFPVHTKEVNWLSVMTVVR